MSCSAKHAVKQRRREKQARKEARVARNKSNSNESKWRLGNMMNVFMSRRYPQ